MTTISETIQMHTERWFELDHDKGQRAIGLHREAWQRPRGFESPLVTGIRAWIGYAEAHQARYESPIGDDGVLGPAWAAWGSAIIGLLNGESGRLDCGSLDALIRDVAGAAGHYEEM